MRSLPHWLWRPQCSPLCFVFFLPVALQVFVCTSCSFGRLLVSSLLFFWSFRLYCVTCSIQVIAVLFHLFIFWVFRVVVDGAVDVVVVALALAVTFLGTLVVVACLFGVALVVSLVVAFLCCSTCCYFGCCVCCCSCLGCYCRGWCWQVCSHEVVGVKRFVFKAVLLLRFCSQCCFWGSAGVLVFFAFTLVVGILSGFLLFVVSHPQTATTNIIKPTCVCQTLQHCFFTVS